MAPELRKKKAVAETQKANGATKVVEKTAKAGKRKAAEDGSPVSLKKQKSTKKTTIAPKSKDEPTKKSKSKKSATAEELEPAQEDDAAQLALEASSVEAEEGEENAQALALRLDSEDEDGANGESLFKSGQDVGKAPKVSKQVQKAANPATGEPGVIYIGRIPHGFYEYEMKQYFSQFGPINKIRLSRNKKTGASKHFAFLEFAEAGTADIVAKTMDNYLLFGHILKCSVIPKEQVHEDLFKGANRRFKAVPWNKLAGNKLARPLSESAWESKVAKEQDKRAKNAAKLKAMGYDFEAPQLKDVPPPPPPLVDDVEAMKAIEAPPAGAKGDEGADKAVESAKAVSVESTKGEPEAEVVTSISATKTKAPKKGKSKKSKA